MKLFNTEKELATKIIQYLKDLKWEVYQEVDLKPWGGVADIIATQGKLLWTLECKLTFGFKVLRQAAKHKPYANFVSICTPRTTDTHIEILNFMCIGHLQSSLGYVDEIVKPKLSRKINKIYWEKLCEEQKTFSCAGSANGGQFTPFKQTVRNFRNYIKENPGCSMKDAINSIEHHYSCTSTAKASIYTWIRAGVITGIIREKGKLFLDKGNLNG